MGLLVFLVIGLIAGLLARAILPGNRSMGFLATTLLGLVGSLVGGLIGSLFDSDGALLDLHPAGILMSVVGALMVLALVGFAGRRHRAAV